MNNFSTINTIGYYCGRFAPGFFGEPLNSFSNLATIIGVFYAWRVWRSNGNGDRWQLVLFVLAAISAISSLVFHSMPTPETLMVDLVPIQIFNLAFLSYVALRYLRLSIAVTVALVLAFFFARQIWIIFTPSGALGGGITHIPAILLLVAGAFLVRLNGYLLWRYMVAAVITYLAALFVRSWDIALCSSFPWGLHWAWHLFGALTTSLLLYGIATVPPNPAVEIGAKARSPSIAKQWVMRFCLGMLSVVLLATVVGVAYETSGRRQATQDYPAPGKLVDIGGRRIQLDCRGTGSPTVVFESGLDMSGSLSWSMVQDEIAKSTRACAYSRAGIMWSDPTDAHQNGKAIAEDLHTTLSKAGEQVPFVLVGHSLGGPYIMTYTKYFGQEVAGLVFVDVSHPDQVQRSSGEDRAELKEMQSRDKILAALSWAGVERAVTASNKGMPNRPEWVNQAVKAYRPTSLGSMVKESDASDETLAEAGTFRQLGDRPLFVLTAMARFSDQALSNWKMPAEQANKHKEIWMQMQDELVTWSSQSQHQLVPDANHYIQFDRPDIVVAAVRSVVERVRTNRNSSRHPIKLGLEAFTVSTN